MLQKKVRLSGTLPMRKERVIRLVTLANHFVCNVMLEREGTTINGKSMLGLLSITGFCGRDYMLVTSGEDEKEALEQLCLLFEEKQNSSGAAIEHPAAADD